MTPLIQVETAVPQIKALPKGLTLQASLKSSTSNLREHFETLINGGVKARMEISAWQDFSKAPGIPLMISTDAQYAANIVVLRQAEIKPIRWNLQVKEKSNWVMAWS